MLVYTVSFENVTVSAISDLIELRPADDRPLSILGWAFWQTSDVGDAAEEILRYEIRRGHTTSGSGGTTPTPIPLDPSYPAAAFAAEVNNTTIASAGTTTLVMPGSIPIRVGEYVKLPPEEVIRVRQSDTSLVFRLLAAPADPLSMGGYVIVRED